METVYVKKLREIKKLKKQLEKTLDLDLVIKGARIEIDGSTENEFDAMRVFEAINFGFSIPKALLLKQEDFVFKKVHIKEYTNRNLKDIKARLIGTHGKTKETLASISDCEILIGESDVGIIGFVDDVEGLETAIVGIIKGSKQANMYRYLERMNREKKNEEDEL